MRSRIVKPSLITNLHSPGGSHVPTEASPKGMRKIIDLGSKTQRHADANDHIISFQQA